MNNISIPTVQLEHINERLVLLTLDTEHLSMALQAVQVNCEVSRGVLNAVIMALSGNAAISEELSDQLDGILTAQARGLTHDA